MVDRCINITNSKVIEIGEQLGVSPVTAAAKISVWQSRYGNKVPTIQDLKEFEFSRNVKGDNAIVLTTNTKWLYERYNLLNNKGNVKDVSDLTKPALNNWLTKLNQSPYFSFKARVTPSGTKIFIFGKEEFKELKWDSLSENVRTNLSKKGITTLIFEGLNEKEKQNLIRCHG